MDIVFARETFIAGHVTVIAGSHWPITDPVVKAHRDLFTDDPSFGLSTSAPVKQPEKAVEQTTAAPGEKRTRTRG